MAETQSSPDPAPTVPPPRRRSRFGLFLVLFLLVVLGGCALYAWGALHWSYSDGERAGFVQKFSRKGWICKTWEGEMAIVSMPGSATDKFAFTVWDDAAAEQISTYM